MGLGREIASKPRSMINSALHLRPISSKRKLSQSLCSMDPLLCSAQLGAIYSRPWASLSPCRLLNSHLQQQGFYTHRRGFSVSACDFSELSPQGHHPMSSCKSQLLLLLYKRHNSSCLPVSSACAGLQRCCRALHPSGPLASKVDLTSGT